MQPKITPKAGYLHVLFPRGISMDNYVAAERDIEARIHDHDFVVLDLRETDTLYSTALGVIIRIRKSVLDRGGALCLVNVNKPCRTLLSAVHLDKVITIYATDVEFEISREEVWERAAQQVAGQFVCVAHVEDDICRVTVSGSMMSRADLTAFEEILENQSKTFVFDFTGLDAVDSVGAQVLSKVLAALAERNVVCLGYGAPTDVADLFVYLSIGDYVSLYADEREAIEELGDR